MKIMTMIGLAAGTLTTISYLPQIIKTWKLKETKDISLTMYSILTVGVALWLIYGILLKEVPIIAANAVSFFFSSSILFLKIRFG
jgi:MtN3 and saliva related transmembrane protein